MRLDAVAVAVVAVAAAQGRAVAVEVVVPAHQASSLFARLRPFVEQLVRVAVEAFAGGESDVRLHDVVGREHLRQADQHLGAALALRAGGVVDRARGRLDDVVRRAHADVPGGVVVSGGPAATERHRGGHVVVLGGVAHANGIRRALEVAGHLDVARGAFFALDGGAGDSGLPTRRGARQAVHHQRALDGPVAPDRRQQVHRGRIDGDALEARLRLLVVQVLDRDDAFFGRLGVRRRLPNAGQCQRGQHDGAGRATSGCGDNDRAPGFLLHGVRLHAVLFNAVQLQPQPPPPTP